MSKFEQRCYVVLKSVPKGKVTTYSAIAKRLNSNAFRAVGGAMRKNLDRSVPCHRVICSDGRIGNYNRGSALKLKMLVQEGVKVTGGRVDLKRFSARLS